MNILANKISVFELSDHNDVFEYAKQINYDKNKHNIFTFRINTKDIYDYQTEIIKQKTLNSFLKCYDEYFNYHNIKSQKHKDNLVFKKYVKNDIFLKHVDCSDENEIYYIAIIFLNDDFIGGKLVFDDLTISYLPKKNSLIIFPCYIYHSVERLLSGERYTIMYSTKSL